MIVTADLPDDIEALKAMIVAQSEQNARLETLIAALRQAMFGRKSEKADPDQFELTLEDIEAGIAQVEAEGEADPMVTPTQTSKSRKTNRGALPKHLPRIEEAIEPDSTACNGIVQAPAPAHLIPGGMPTEATVAHVLVSRYADHPPLYRQAQIYSRQGLNLDRSTLAAWVGRAAFELGPIFDALITDLKRSTKLFMDETKAPVLDPGRKKTKTGCFWALARDDTPWNGDDPPGVAFTYAPGRSGQYAEDILKDFGGIVQVDGYAGYNRLLKRPAQDIQLAYCWAHARRKLYEVAKTGTTPIADEGLQQIAALYRIEKAIRGLSPPERLAARQEHSKPIVEAFEAWLTANRARVSAKAPLGEALKYIAKYWDGLCLFPSDGRIELDSNAVERTIRPIALNRKNALFAGHDAGAQNWATIASLIETRKLNAVDPHAWLTDTLKAIVNGHKQSDIDVLLPWNYNGS